MTCPICRLEPADARFGRTCSWQCEAKRAREDRAARPRLERDRCECGGEFHSRVERGLVVIRCTRCRSSESLSPLVVQSLVA